MFQCFVVQGEGVFQYFVQLEIGFGFDQFQCVFVVEGVGDDWDQWEFVFGQFDDVCYCVFVVCYGYDQVGIGCVCRVQYIKFCVVVILDFEVEFIGIVDGLWVFFDDGQ